MILGLFTLACKHRFPLVASVLWNVVHFLYFSFHFTTFQHFISQTPAWEARQVFTWNQSWETKLVCEVNIFTFQNPIPTGASNWSLLVLTVQASSLLSDQGAWGKLFLCVFLQLVFLPEPTKVLFLDANLPIIHGDDTHQQLHQKEPYSWNHVHRLCHYIGDCVKVWEPVKGRQIFQTSWFRLAS